ncbi:hypothetical protein LTS10_011368 [Elasticomyces elasticus]|nr:hypothetical protein LTS10_011368 [Elasticomyces elasticus]
MTAKTTAPARDGGVVDDVIVESNEIGGDVNDLSDSQMLNALPYQALRRRQHGKRAHVENAALTVRVTEAEDSVKELKNSSLGQGIDMVCERVEAALGVKKALDGYNKELDRYLEQARIERAADVKRLDDSSKKLDGPSKKHKDAVEAAEVIFKSFDNEVTQLRRTLDDPAVVSVLLLLLQWFI